MKFIIDADRDARDFFDADGVIAIRDVLLKAGIGERVRKKANRRFGRILRGEFDALIFE